MRFNNAISTDRIIEMKRLWLLVLPVLMTAAMFLQQKYTPTTTADPTQKKIMMFMPLIFGFIMKDLPSGLVLYIFVSTIFGVIQQLWVYKSTPG